MHWKTRYAQFILNSNLTDAKSVPSTSVVHLFLYRMGIFSIGFHSIFSNISLSGYILASESVSSIPLSENQLMSQSNGSLLLSNHIHLVSNIRIASNLYLASNSFEPSLLQIN